MVLWFDDFMVDGFMVLLFYCFVVSSMESGETYELVEWVSENLFSVLPLYCSKNPEKCKAGACSNFKWGITQEHQRHLLDTTRL